MNRLVCSVFMLMSLTGAVMAKSTDLIAGLKIDYTKSSMAQVNNYLNKGVDVPGFGAGVSVMMDVQMTATPFLYLGVRSGYIYSTPVNSSYDHMLYQQTTTINASLIPIMVGMNLNLVLPNTPISILLGTYGGYGVALGSLQNDISALGQTATCIQPYRGGHLMGELTSAIVFKWSSKLSLTINGGYRAANVAKMVQSKDVTFGGIPPVSFPIGNKGDVLKDTDGSDLAFDYSGFSLGAGISISF